MAPDIPSVDEEKRLGIAWFTLAGAVIVHGTKDPVYEGEGEDPDPLPTQDHFED